MPSRGTHRRRRLGRALVVFVVLLASLASGAALGAPNPATKSFNIGPYTRATGLATGPDGALWFIGWGRTPNGSQPADVLGRLGLDGAKSQIELSARAAAAGGKIVLAADKSFWFTDPAANAVGRLTTTGQVTEYPLPTANARPGAIAAGPAGTVWFVEEAVDKVGRVSASGQIAEFTLPPGSLPSGIAEGPDGAMWVVEKGSANIARITAAGEITANYALPDPGSRPHAIVLGPGNELWFSEEAKPRVGRISPQGAIEEFRIPGENGTGELALGGDGNLWFTTGYAIGSISARGASGEPECISIACNSPINALAKGPDGGLWFATGIEQGGGGGTILASSFAGGSIGRFYAPLLEQRLGKQATRVNDGLTTVALSCHGGTANESCRGWLRLTAKLGGRKVRLDQHRYRLQPATGRRLPLRLGARGKRALSSGRKRLVVQVVATRIGGDAVAKRYVLQARGRR